jgi:RHS repeat-associated protein
MSARLQSAGKLEAKVVCQYVWGARKGHRDELILRDRDATASSSESSGEFLNERLWSLMDYYDPTSIVDNSASVVERYRFSAFGLRSIMDRDFTPLDTSGYGWDFAFKGQFLDLDTGYYNYGYRYYSPGLGRWLSRDPIGEQGGNNLYAMVDNNSLNGVDHLGLAAVSPEFAAITALLALVAACAFPYVTQSEQLYSGKPDVWRHCWVSCKISRTCGGQIAELTGFAKEAADAAKRIYCAQYPDSAICQTGHGSWTDSLYDILANQQCIGVESILFGAVGGWIGSCFRESCESCCDSKTFLDSD